MKMCSNEMTNVCKNLLVSTLIVLVVYSLNYIYERQQLNTGITTNIKYSCFSTNLLTYSYAQESLHDAKKTREERLRKEEELRIKKQKETEEKRRKEAELKRKKEEEEKKQKELEAQKVAEQEAYEEVENQFLIQRQQTVMSRGEVDTDFALYNPNIQMPIEHQSYLFETCQKRNVDYLFALAVIKIESSFNNNVEYQGNYGYFQVNKCHISNLSQLGFGADPFNPYTNIEWGVYILSNIFNKYQTQELTEEVYEVILSVYNKGEGGYNNTGKAYEYINKHRQALIEIKNLYNN